MQIKQTNVWLRNFLILAKFFSQNKFHMYKFTYEKGDDDTVNSFCSITLSLETNFLGNN